MRKREISMASLQVRDLPDHIYNLLVEQARQEHRSLAQQAVAVLAKGLGIDLSPSARRKKILDNLEKYPIASDPSLIPDPVALIREDRSR
ncbi:MAG: hypothetical protein R3A13_07600 [Bdellovibrionota bacterium]